MNTVSYGRTISKNYQSQKVEIMLEVLEGWTEAETLQLAKYMVDESLDIRTVTQRQANKLYRAYFGTDTDIKELKLA